MLLEALGNIPLQTNPQFWRNKMMDDMSIYKYYSNTKAIVTNIKTLSKLKPFYTNNWEAINAFIEEDGLAAFIAGLRKPYFGYGPGRSVCFLIQIHFE
jgi:hypothetical protein